LLLGRAYHAQGKSQLAVEHYQRAGQLARRELEDLYPASSHQPSQGWGETARRVSGLLLPPVLAAWANARLSPLEISLVAWIALLAAGAGAYLWVSATDVPRNSGMCRLFGEAGVTSVWQQVLVGLPGTALWLIAFGLILVKV
jgi:hypothetical protein